MDSMSALWAAAGLVVGMAIGLTGIGSGSLMTPILVLLFGQSPTVAVGTDVVFSAVTKLAATASFGLSRRVDWAVVGRLLLGSIPGAALSVAWIWSARNHAQEIDAVVSRGLAWILAVAAVGLIAQYPLRHLTLQWMVSWSRRAERYAVLLTALGGAFMGVAVTLTSVGAGTLGIVLLVCLYPLRLSSDRLVATDVAQAVPVAVVAAAAHSAIGHVDWRLLGWLLAGSVPGVLLASRLAIRLPAAFTRVLIGLMLAAVCGRLLVLA